MLSGNTGGLFGTPQSGLSGLGRGVGIGGGGLGASTGGGLFQRQSGGLFGNPGTGTGGLGATGTGGGGLFGSTPSSSQQGGTGLFGGGGLTGGLGGGATGGGLFQTPGQQNTLGAQQKTGLFGQSPMLGGAGTSTGSVLGGGLFNQTNVTSGGLFKPPTTGAGGLQLGQTAGGLGQTTGGLFGAGGAGVGGGLGGLGNQMVGTAAKYEPTKGTDTLSKNGVTYNVNTLLHCATAANSYMNKSLEELRFEDYSAGRKGAAAGAGLFGASQGLSLGGTGVGGGLFGTQNKGLGAGGIGGLGNQSQLGGGLGGTSTAGGLFGQQTKLGGGGGIFGSTPGQTKLGGGLGGGTGLFGGQPQSQAGGGLFTGGGGLFNQSGTGAQLGGLGTQSQLGGGGGLFPYRLGTGLGQTGGLGGLGTGLGGATGGLGGLGTTGGLGLGGLGNQTSQAGGGLGLFGNKTGGTGLGTGLGGFSQTGQLGGGLGGLGATGGGLSLGAGLNTGLGGAKLGGTSLTGAVSGTMGLGGAGLGQNLTLGQSTLQQQQQEAQLKQQLEILANSPYGDSSLFRSAMFDASKHQKTKPSPPSEPTKPSPSTLQYKLNLRPSAKVKTISLSSPARHKEKSHLFEGLEDSSLGTPNSSLGAGSNGETFVPRKSVKKLTIKPKPTQPQVWPDSTTPPSGSDTPSAPSPILPSSSASGHTHPVPPTPDVEPVPPPHSSKTTPLAHGSSTPSVSSMDVLAGGGSSASSHDSTGTPEITLGNNALKKSSIRSLTGGIGSIGASPALPQKTSAKKVTVLEPVEEENSLTRSPLKQRSPPNSNQQSSQQRPCEVTLTDPSYYTLPTLDQCDRMVQQDGSCVIDGFTVGRRDFGEICFLGKTDVKGLNLDKIVNIEAREVVVYPDDLPEPKPAVGEELNKPAIVQMHGYWPKDKTTGDLIQDQQRLDRMNYAAKLHRLVAKIGGTFIKYRPETGTCIFKVAHFSKYKLEADDSEDEGDQQQQQQPQGGGPGLVKKLKTVQKEVPPQQILNGKVPTPRRPTPPPPHTGPGQQDEEMLLDSPSSSSEGDVVMDSAPTPMLPAQEIVGTRTHHVQIMKASFFSGKKDDLNQTYALMSPRLHPPLAQSSRPGSRLDERALLRTSHSPSVQPSPALSRSALLQSSFLAGNVAPSPPPSHLTSFREQAPPTSESIDPFSHFHPTPSFSRHRPHVASVAVSSRQAQSAVLMATRDLQVLVPVKDKMERCLSDHGLLLGKSFRVGWGPNWTLAHSGLQVSPSAKPAAPAERQWRKGGLFLPKDLPPITEKEGHPVRVILEQVHVSTTSDICDSFEPFLSCQLANTTIHKDSTSSCPTCCPVSGTTLLNTFSDEARKHPIPAPGTGGPGEREGEAELRTQQQLRRVLQLMVVLWGDLPSECSTDWQDYERQQLRKQRLYRWLKETNRLITEKETSALTDSEEAYLKSLYTLAAGQQLAAACKLAQQKKDHKLACLISQATYSAPINKLFLCDQLEKWARGAGSSVLDYLHPVRLKLYVLLAGLMTWNRQLLPPTLDMPTSRRPAPINTCEGLDWKRSLALHLTFKCGLSASVTDVLHAYVDGFQDDEAYAPPPYPPYIEARDSETTPTLPYDTCYHLLRLYCHGDHSLELTVQPASSTPHQLDYRISWMVWSILSSLGYTHMSPSSISRLLASFASQLERAHKWQWAVFALLHLQDSVLCATAVRETLARNCSADEQLQPSESFVIEKLSVPEEWVYCAKAQQAGAQEWYDVMAAHLLSAGQWDEAHAVILEHLAVDAIINEDTDELLRMLEHLAAPERSRHIQSWECGGSVFLDYLRISRTCKQLSKMPGEMELEALYVGLKQLSARICQLPSDTPRKVLCQSDMAQCTGNMYRTVLQLKAVRSGAKKSSFKDEMVECLRVLPLPPDYAATEYRTLLQAYMHNTKTSK